MQTRDMALLFGISILLRGLLLAVGISQQGAEAFLSMPGDSGNYVSAAVALLNGEGAYERTFFAFGPGYSIALLAQMWIFGVSGVTLLIINVLFSSLACILIYRITLLLGFERPVAFFAGLAAAFSTTAITLSCILLSDTTYLFLVSATLTLFLSGLKENRRMKIVSAGALLSFAILTRSIGQMMPLVLLILFMLSALKENLKPNEATRYYRSRWVSVALCLALPIVTMSVWMARNYHVNSHAVLSFTAVGAPARVAAITLEDLTGKSESAIRSDRASEYQKYIGKDSVSFPFK